MLQGMSWVYVYCESVSNIPFYDLNISGSEGKQYRVGSGDCINHQHNLVLWQVSCIGLVTFEDDHF